MQMQEKADLCSLDRNRTTVLRGIGIILVLLGHTGYVEWGGAGGVVIFLILSGYGIDQTCTGKGFSGYWIKRIKRVWIPYVLASLYHIAANQITDPKAILCTVVGLDLNLGCLADKTMWYISYILLWYLAYYMIARLSSLIGKTSLQQTVKCIGLLATAYGFRALCVLGFWHSGSLAWLYQFAFPLGVILSRMSFLRARKPFCTGIWLTLFLASTLYTLSAYAHEYSLKSAMAMGFLFIAASQLISFRGTGERILLWFGTYSYSLYLFEGMVLEKRNIWFGDLENQVLIDLAFVLCTCIFALAFQEGISSRLMKSLMREKNP